MRGKKRPRTGGFEKERERIVGEYAAGEYLKTAADLACEDEIKVRQTAEEAIDEHNRSGKTD